MAATHPAVHSKIPGLAIALGVLAIYLALPTKNYYWDGIGFAQAIESAPSLNASLLHPNHLIYTAAGYLDYRLVQLVGLHPRALTVLRVTNSILSAASAWLLFGLLMSCFGSLYLGCVLTLAFAFAATWWRFSTDANAYIPSVFFLLLSLRLVLRGRKSKPVLAGLIHSGAMLFHELAVFFFPVMLWGLWQQTSSQSRGQRLRILLRYTAAAFFLTVAAYYFGFRWQTASSGAGQAGLRPFLSWLTSHSPEVGFSMNPLTDTVLSLRSHLRLFLGGRVIWAVRQWPRFSAAMISILIAALATLVYRWIRYQGALRSGTGVFRIDPRLQHLAWLAGIWGGCYICFLFFWLPGNTFYRLFYLPALILLAGIFLCWRETPGRRRPYAAAVFVGMMALSNLTFAIFPNSQVRSNPPLEFALRMGRIWTPGTMVYYGTFNTDDWTIRYFNPRTTWKKWKPQDLRSLEPRRGMQAGAPAAWLDTTALDLIRSLPRGNDWLARHAPAASRVEIVDDRHRIIFQKIDPR